MREISPVDYPDGLKARCVGVNWRHLYGSAGQEIRVDDVSPSGDISRYNLIAYDSEGRITEAKRFDSKGQSRGWIRFEYAPEEKQVKVSWCFFENVSTKGRQLDAVLTYDENGRWTSRRFLFGLDDFAEFEYDKDGNLVNEIRDRYGYKFSYKFDKYGNWIERLKAPYRLDGNQWNVRSNQVTKRIITYYPER